MNADTFNAVIKMIDKEVRRESFADLYEYLGITTDDYVKFVQYAKVGFDVKKEMSFFKGGEPFEVGEMLFERIAPEKIEEMKKEIEE